MPRKLRFAPIKNAERKRQAEKKTKELKVCRPVDYIHLTCTCSINYSHYILF